MLMAKTTAPFFPRLYQRNFFSLPFKNQPRRRRLCFLARDNDFVFILHLFSI
jgi:hypothetical protein